mmetsp:Transcript_37068/g.54305  ORF Transcript_37068/g.54305 Transcript_37068/m.54305 type:complete len:90 (+) Transcript_37068:20-289(+)
MNYGMKHQQKMYAPPLPPLYLILTLHTVYIYNTQHHPSSLNNLLQSLPSFFDLETFNAISGFQIHKAFKGQSTFHPFLDLRNLVLGVAH